MRKNTPEYKHVVFKNIIKKKVGSNLKPEPYFYLIV